MGSLTAPTTPIEDPCTFSASLSGGLTSPTTLRSTTYTLQTSLYEGLYDGTYRTLTSPFQSPSLRESPRSWEPDLPCSKIIQEFGESKMFDESRLKRLRSRAVRRYNGTLLKQKQMALRSLSSLDGLLSFNGEYIVVELQVCEVDLANVALAEDLREKYQSLLTLVKDYQDPYSLESEKKTAEKAMMDAFYEFDDVLKMLRYLDTQKDGLVEALEVQKGNVGIKGWFHKVFQR